MLIQFHLLQNYAPANLNRDDTGSPKDAVFGGVMRGRISSQCLKRSIRESPVFQSSFADTGRLGARTRLLPQLVGSALSDLQVEPAKIARIVRRVADLGREAGRTAASEGATAETVGEDDIQTDAGRDESTHAGLETRQLIFVDPDEIRPLAERLLAAYDAAGDRGFARLQMRELERSLGRLTPRSVDIAMFGRMTTSEAFQDMTASVQVAHAISTHTLEQHFDFFAAVDDLSTDTGAAMLGDVEFNSSTYYKYLNLHWDQLLANLGGDLAVAREAALALLEAAATSQPSGKQNSFAAYSLPDLVLVEVSDANLPVSYANAFLKPARASDRESLVDASVDLLASYMVRIQGTYDLAADRAYVVLGDYTLPGATRMPSLVALSRWLGGRLPRA